jgi:hypothetical protein
VSLTGLTKQKGCMQVGKETCNKIDLAVFYSL